MIVVFHRGLRCDQANKQNLYYKNQLKKEQQHIVQYQVWMFVLKQEQQMEIMIDGFVDLLLIIKPLVGLDLKKMPK